MLLFSVARRLNINLFKVWFAIYLSFTILPVCARQQVANAAGVSQYPPELSGKIEKALRAKGIEYHPRTEHLHDDGSPVFTNRLILEDSPYLLQHAHNPVDWYPWGKEAFDRARRENKPVFVSIGYSTCHWCHVMERESFENIDIAHFLNEHFIAIKVDRERRPDVDMVYMTAAMVLTGSGGWPLSSFLTPDGKTFYTGTYFPPDDFMQILVRADQLWQTQETGLREQADAIATTVQRVMTDRDEAQTIDSGVIKQAITNILQRYDAVNGGFGPAPKFPNETLLLLLLESAKRGNDPEALKAAEHSLQAMAHGGIYDHIGGGFHRYSTDNYWLVPHFEKMLYNQANLSRVYLAAYEITGKSLYRRVARQTLDYVLRELTSFDGGFYSATDADSEGQEGAFFTWTVKQIEQSLAAPEAALAIELFGVSSSGNYEGKNILYLSKPVERFAQEHKRKLPDLINDIDRIRGRLQQTRRQRPAPDRDDKIITAWNGLMITALIEAAGVLDDPEYLFAAEKAADFIWINQRNEKGDLWRVSLNGNNSVAAVQKDYAFLAEAFIKLFDHTAKEHWLERAEILVRTMLDKFQDAAGGGFFMNPELSETPMMARPKDNSDSALPSGNAVALRVLAMLTKRTAKNDYLHSAESSLSAFSSRIQAFPDAYSYMLLGAQDHLYKESGHQQYAARGAVKANVTVRRKKDQDLWLAISLTIGPGWHVNAHQPLDSKYIATTVSIDQPNHGWTMDKVEYPQPLFKRLGFSQNRLALFEGSILIRARLKDISTERSNMLPVKLNLQACNNEICLPPETLILRVSMHTISANENK